MLRFSIKPLTLRLKLSIHRSIRREANVRTRSSGSGTLQTVQPVTNLVPTGESVVTGSNLADGNRQRRNPGTGQLNRAATADRQVENH